MKTAFVTGATGFLGHHLIDILRENDWHITAMVRDVEKARSLLGSEVTFVAGDLSTPFSVTEAMPDKPDAVFHAAANTSTWAKEAQLQEIANIEGTRALLQTALDKEAGRFVHVSSIAVYGHHQSLITESTPRLGAASWINYARTKSFAERKVKEAADRGMNTVILNPTHIIGRYDNHNWARLILQMAHGTLPATPPGNGNFANGRAVAEACLAAYHKGRRGQNYILGGPNASFKEFLDIAAEKIGGIKPPRVMAPFLLKAYAEIQAVIADFSGKRPKVTCEEAAMACEQLDATSDKAIAELDYRLVPLEESVVQSVEYLRETGLLPA